MFFQPRSLQQRTFLYILVPTFLLLVAFWVGGYLVVRDLLLDQWGRLAVSQLELTAHTVDMQLRKPKDLLLLLQDNGSSEISSELVSFVVNRIEELDGVVAVNIEWPGATPRPESSPGSMMAEMPRMMGHFHFDRFSITPPRFDTTLNDRTISLLSVFRNATNTATGRVEVQIAFDLLIERIVDAPWWQNYKAYLVDDQARVLTSTGAEMGLEDYYPLRAFGTINELESRTLTAMREQPSGTVFGDGRPPEEISGFYRLREAPWTLVVIAPGEMVLRPIIKFGIIYGAAMTVSTVLILVVIRFSMGRITEGIRRISTVAEELAGGRFGPPLPIIGRDEVAELAQSFNKMSRYLRQRLVLKEAIDIAREVQQNLLPHGSYSAQGVEICGKSIYCDETGGDYLDIIQYPGEKGRVGLAVGDVVGHGIGAALLMTSVRAMLRTRIAQPGRLDQVMADVNRLLCFDTREAGSFVSLMYLEVDSEQKKIAWVRAGHDPAMLYFPETGSFQDLKGQGAVLGVDPTCRFEYNELALGDDTGLIFLGSDGAWEMENETGERFGKKRIRTILQTVSDQSPARIVDGLLDAIERFRGVRPQGDDVTLAVVKIRAGGFFDHG